MEINPPTNRVGIVNHTNTDTPVTGEEKNWTERPKQPMVPTQSLEKGPEILEIEIHINPNESTSRQCKVYEVI